MNVNDPVHALRRSLPRSAALLRLAEAHDRWSDAEELHRLVGNDSMADEAHRVAVRILRAYLAEMDDVKPAGLP